MSFFCCSVNFIFHQPSITVTLSFCYVFNTSLSTSKLLVPRVSSRTHPELKWYKGGKTEAMYNLGMARPQKWIH